MISENDLDNLVYAIVQECSTFVPPLGRSEIEEIAVEQIELRMREQIKASLGRLVTQGQLAESKAYKALRYHLAAGTAA